jgi:adenine deaminase
LTVPSPCRVRASILVCISLLTIFIVGCSESQSLSASLVIKGARVWTGDPAQSWAEAVAVRGENIIAVGTTAEIDRLIRADTQVIEADGGMLVPGR